MNIFLTVALARKEYFENPNPTNKIKVSLVIQKITKDLIDNSCSEKPIYSQVQLQYIGFFLITVLTEIKIGYTSTLISTTIH